MEELTLPWSTEEIRLLCPQVDLIPSVLMKLRQEMAPTVLLIPDSPQEAWHRSALNIAVQAYRLNKPPDGDLGCSTVVKPRLAATTVRSEYATRSRTMSRCKRLGAPGATQAGNQYREMTNAALQSRVSGIGTGAKRPSDLLAEYGMNDKTASTESSKWRCYRQFPEENGTDPLPVTEASLPGFVGWLAEQREFETALRIQFIFSGYISAVRTTHHAVLGYEVPPVPNARAYGARL